MRNIKRVILAGSLAVKRVAMLVIDFDPPWVKSTRKRDGAIFAADVLVT